MNVGALAAATDATVLVLKTVLFTPVSAATKLDGIAVMLVHREWPLSGRVEWPPAENRKHFILSIHQMKVLQGQHLNALPSFAPQG